MGRTKSKSYEIDMCSGAILPKMLAFALPLMCSSILQLMFNAADVIVVGRFAGDNSLAAVGSTGTLVNLLTNFFMGLSIGGNVLASRYYGAKQEKELNDTVHTSVTLSLISGVALTVLGLILTRPMLKLLNVPEEILDLAALYLRIYFLGMTATMAYNFGSAILRAVGDTKRPMYYLTFAGVVNVVLNLIFVIFFHMDVAGVALATVISQCISAVLVLRCLMKMDGAMRLDLKKLKVHPQKFRMIISIGVPASIQGILFSISNLSIQSSLNTFGATAVAGNSAAASIDGFLYASMNAFYQAVLSFTSQNMGAGRRDRINKVLFTGMGCATVVGLILGFGATYFGAELLGLYTTSDAVVAMGLDRMQVMTKTYFLCGMMESVVGAMRGMGFSVLPMIVSLIGVCGLRVIYVATLFQMEQFHNLQSLYMTYPISWSITFAAHLTFYFLVKRGLEKNLVKSKRM
ncbi:MAG: MATE family efflux transporter [Lachnospiraceae bacterium]|nr:MATE family efflux transporter [Lachnospiraceae bacterium]